MFLLQATPRIRVLFISTPGRLPYWSLLGNWPSSTSSDAATGSTAPPTSTGYPTGWPIPGHQSPFFVEGTHASLPRDEPATNVSRVFLTFILSFTRLDRSTFHLHGVAQATTRASRTIAPVPQCWDRFGKPSTSILASRTLAMAMSGGGIGIVLPNSLMTDKGEVISKRPQISGLTPAIFIEDISPRLGPFGSVTALDGSGKLGALGQPRKFAYPILQTIKPHLSKCASTTHSLVPSISYHCHRYERA
jgi:hypothetical protein